MQIFVSVPAGGTIALEVEGNDTIEVVKSKIEDETNVPVANQSLTFAGQVLDDGRTLADYNIQKEATLIMIVTGAEPTTTVPPTTVPALQGDALSPTSTSTTAPANHAVVPQPARGATPGVSAGSATPTGTVDGTLAHTGSADPLTALIGTTALTVGAVLVLLTRLASSRHSRLP